MLKVLKATQRAGLLALTGTLFLGCHSSSNPPATQSETQPQPQPQAQVLPHAHIFPEVSAAQGDIDAALKTAAAEHKRVLLDFGGDWCPDCQVLNVYFHRPENQPLLDQNFVVVEVNVGRHIDENLALGAKYGVDLKKGVPALAVVSAKNKVIYGQSGGQFSNMRRMEPSSVHDFLDQWKPGRTAAGAAGE
ncbi:thioredoxin family protein [Acidipila sp. EB88]|uniref:thioredoxin family protein n=1 Tax=Acidipila sp. EB88 TaxID=2305226 RepID=UPI000F5ED437|nr:thioredoxin family protein [Acidipila sp. EB88]RRA48181.1 DUF255 domain-containing protein [Acidipila sp. EB88]